MLWSRPWLCELVDLHQPCCTWCRPIILTNPAPDRVSHHSFVPCWHRTLWIKAGHLERHWGSPLLNYRLISVSLSTEFTLSFNCKLGTVCKLHENWYELDSTHVQSFLCLQYFSFYGCLCIYALLHCVPSNLCLCMQAFMCANWKPLVCCHMARACVNMWIPVFTKIVPGIACRWLLFLPLVSAAWAVLILPRCEPSQATVSPAAAHNGVEV